MAIFNKVKIAWFGKHFGEEPPLVGDKNQGAGGIFFSGCNLRCVFCQNWQISQNGMGKEYSAEELADIMLDLQKQNVVNIDLVTPSNWWPEIIFAIKSAKRRGLKIPVVWNSNAYERVEIIKKLTGLVDMYLPDFKYGLDESAKKYSNAVNYPAIAEAAIREMYRQVGIQGLIVRHMILPNNLNNSFKALEIISKMDKNISVSLMRQYYPCHQAEKFPEINRRITDEEFTKVFDKMIALGFLNGWTQKKNCEKIFMPDFFKAKPFKN
jgi:putative pyruvate formate lyase activating enzyme